MDAVRESYYETRAERSVLKNSARHKANGSAVTKLGNKPVTTKEIYDKHGPIYTYPSTDSFMSYSDFVSLPPDLKVEFVNKMMDRYDIQMCHLSKYLFNKGDDGLKANLRRIFALIDGKNVRLLDLCDYKKPRAMTGLLRFQADVEDWRKRTKIAEMLDREAEETRKNAPAEFTTYDKYKALNDEDKLDYINKLIRQWDVSPEVISKELFKKSEPIVRTYLNKHGYREKLIKIGRRTSDSSLAANGRFHNAVKQWEESLNMKALGTVTEEEPVKDPAVDIQPMLEKKKTKLEQQLEQSSRLMDVLHSRPSILPDDSEFELDNETFAKVLDGARTMVDRMKERRTSKWYQPAKEPEAELEPETAVEPDPMEYHQMHFSTNYISSNGINMDEIYAIASFFKNCKRVKVNLEISEV